MIWPEGFVALVHWDVRDRLFLCCCEGFSLWFALGGSCVHGENEIFSHVGSTFIAATRII